MRINEFLGEKVTRLEADKLLNPDNPEFIKLIRLITGDDKTPSIKTIKISREQIKIHLLRVIFFNIESSFLIF